MASNSEYILGTNGYGVDLLGIANFRACLLTCLMIEDGLQYWVPRRFRINMNYLEIVRLRKVSYFRKPVDYYFLEAVSFD
jgi:hypothetical protein